MKPYFNLLIWLFLGVAIGLVAYIIFYPPILPSTGANDTSDDYTPLEDVVEKEPVTLIIINSPCERCNYNELSIQQAIEYLSDSSTISLLAVQNITYPSDDASMLISKYNITELPCMIISGNINAGDVLVSMWLENAGTQESDGALVSRNIYPPYYDIGQERSFGLITGIAIQSSNCSTCLDANEYMNSLEDESIGFVFLNKTVLQENDSIAQDLIQKYNITKLPVLLMDEEFFVYPLSENMVTLGSVESDNWFVLREVKPPYQEFPSHEIRGIVDAIYVYNSSCEACYSPQDVGGYFVQYAELHINNETTYDVNSTEARLLIQKYNLTQLPAILFSPEASAYLSFDSTWIGTNNTIEQDGWYVFRNYDLLGYGYQNLTG